MQQFDVIVVGGGMVGASVALKLAHSGLQVALVERQTPAVYQAQQPLDLRVSAINQRSERWLTELGAWSLLQQWRLCPYRRLQAFEGDTPGLTFTADELNLSHLGHIVENSLIQQALWQQFPEQLTVFSPATVTGFSQQQALAQLTTKEFGCLSAQLVIAADGGQSQLRQLAGIGSTGWMYQQACLVLEVDTELPQQDITWQQFHPTGPRAMLPLSGHKASLVWYDAHQKVQQLAALSLPELSRQVQAAFPAKLGAVQVTRCAWFPLARNHANSYAKGRLVLVGDAAHSINPLAGQGVNLGFADARVLCEVLLSANTGALASAELLARYEKERRRANALMMSAMDGLYQLFSNELPPLKLARQLGLTLAERAGPLKRLVSRYAVL